MQSKQSRLDKKKLYLAISGILAATSGAAFAQDSSEEEVIVTGIRASLENAADIKRDASGVVDAISAEDIGKFPDANLAESLQRITGVSIDRQNNEGAQITVRGFGPNFNLVTLNGRQMPAASSPEQESIASATQSRAFNFNELASESVSGVEVYKTSRPDLPTGGLGATVNIKTARPFDYDGTKLVGNFKAIHDASVEDGDEVTPEFGGLFSTTFGDGVFGLLASFSYSERHFSEVSTHTDGWLRDNPGSAGYAAWCDSQRLDADGNVLAGDPRFANTNNQCNDAPFVYRPVTNISEIRNFERRRTNGQFVAQFAPIESLTFTLDYVLSRFERDEDRIGTGLFGVADINTFDTRLTENFTLDSTTRNFAADALLYENELVIENDSFGLNIDWQANDYLNLSLDVHSSEAVSQPDGEFNDILALLQGPLGIEHQFDYTSSGVNITTDASGARRGTCQFGAGAGTDGDGNPTVDTDGVPCAEVAGVDGFQAPAGFSPLGVNLRNIAIENQVDQIQFDAVLEADNVTFSAGFSWTDYQVDTNAINTMFQFQGLTPCPTCGDRITRFEIDAPSGFSTVVNTDIASIYLEEFGRQDRNQVPPPPDGFLIFTPQSIFDNAAPTFFGASEESTALYLNMEVESSLLDLPTRLSAGVRYEDTDVTGSAFQTFPISLTITSPTEGQVNTAPGAQPEFFEVEEGYEVFLPSLDFQIEPAENMIARFSYGRTIARPDLNALRPITTVSDFRPGNATAASGNPAILPYSSDNIDLSYEWYYSEGSYFSVAYFLKQVEDYITTSTENDVLLDSNGNPLLNPEGRFVDNLTGPDIAVTSQPGDPIAIFEVTRPLNTDRREADGFEFAVQHLFGESGWGLQANYTLVNSDVEFDPNEFNQQAVLIGLSDSANLVGFYENELFSVRVAANWRDEFLFATNQLRATNEPVYFDEYLQVDLSSSYNVTDNISLTFEILNMFGEDQSQRGRYEDQFLFENDQEPRYSFGIRGNF